jgi:predicted deacetylase
MKKELVIFFGVVVFLIFLLFFIRLVSPVEIDDVNPDIFCSENLLGKSDILWIIPKFENKSVAENKEWCKKISNLNKTIGLHGVYHFFDEFETTRNPEYLLEGSDIFKECFGFAPEIFKPPQLEISGENKKLIKENSLMLKGKVNQLMHKVYHCDDSGLFPNRFIDFF